MPGYIAAHPSLLVGGNMTKPMTVQRAHAINALLVRGWMVREGLEGGRPPSLCGISLREAVEASEIVGKSPEALVQDVPRRKPILCSVDPARVPRLYAWCVVSSQSLPTHG